jgi:arsenite transporter
MGLLEKLQSLIILAAVFLGLALGGVGSIAQHSGQFILPFLFLMLTGVFLHMPLERLTNIFQYRRVSFASLAINFLWTPMLAWLLGWLFLRDQPALWIGLIMLLITPCTDWYLVFTGIARGDVAFSTALLPVNLFLQLILLPVYLLVLAGAVVPVDLRLISESILLVFVLPLLLAFLMRKILVRTKGKTWLEGRFLPKIQPLQIIFLGLAIMAMFASEGRVILQNPRVFSYLVLPLLIFFTVNLLLSLWVTSFLKAGYESCASLTCTTLARNSPLALAIALVAFPEQPLIGLTLVIGPLIELPILALVSQFLLLIRRSNMYPVGRG